MASVITMSSAFFCVLCNESELVASLEGLRMRTHIVESPLLDGER